MRKQPIQSESAFPSAAMWLDLRDLATAEITSETVDHPIESALIPDRGPGGSGTTRETDYPACIR